MMTCYQDTSYQRSFSDNTMLPWLNGTVNYHIILSYNFLLADEAKIRRERDNTKYALMCFSLLVSPTALSTTPLSFVPGYLVPGPHPTTSRTPWRLSGGTTPSTRPACATTRWPPVSATFWSRMPGKLLPRLPLTTILLSALLSVPGG
jgi:hypothetical protein